MLSDAQLHFLRRVQKAETENPVGFTCFDTDGTGKDVPLLVELRMWGFLTYSKTLGARLTDKGKKILSTPPSESRDPMSLFVLSDPVSGQDSVDVLALMDWYAPDLRFQKVLDHGVVELVDIMPRLIPAVLATSGSPLRADLAIPQAARISYQGGTKKASNDVGLIDNLIRNQHTSPIEMVELKWRLRMPIFCMRQHVRHRMSSMNEESARYSELASDFYIPDREHWGMNTVADKQATVQHHISREVIDRLYGWVKEHNEEAYRLYQHLLDGSEDADGDIVVPGVAREQARMVLGVNIYTSCIWKIDLKNLLHYVRLRADKHAQYEIRVYAEAMIRQLEYLCPAAMASFRDHFMDGVNLADSELQVYSLFMRGEAGAAAAVARDSLSWTPRRAAEFVKKLNKLPVMQEHIREASTAHFLHDVEPIEKADIAP